MKRANTILKHARFLNNLKVYPIMPEPIVEEEEEANEAKDLNEDEE